MRVLSHSADNFRNLKETYFEADPSMNVIFGENGQGKTNILESIWLFTGCYSFRTHKNSLLIRSGEEKATASLKFFSGAREQTAEMTVSKTKEIILNGSLCDSPRRMLGEFSAVVFSPSTLSVIKDGPADRRKLLDVALSLIKPNYAVIMAKYLRALNQRNCLLKKVSEFPETQSCLDLWDETLASLGSKIIKYRLDYLKKLESISSEIYSGISSSRETFALAYSFINLETSPEEADIKKRIEETLFRTRETDFKRLYTHCGPHSDDLLFLINGRDARNYASQGQQRSGALALKLSEASIIGQITGESPVVLLDDVMSELDEGRQKFVLNFLNNWQVFITCCDPSQLLRSETGRIFEVKEGRINQL